MVIKKVVLYQKGILEGGKGKTFLITIIYVANGAIIVGV